MFTFFFQLSDGLRHKLMIERLSSLLQVRDAQAVVNRLKFLPENGDAISRIMHLSAALVPKLSCS